MPRGRKQTQTASGHAVPLHGQMSLMVAQPLSQVFGRGPALVPASPPIEAAAAEQKHDNDDDERVVISVTVSPLARSWAI
jgi:hypothetical protein